MFSEDTKKAYFNKLYSDYYTIVYKFVLVSLNFNHTETEDCVQDIFGIILSKIDKISNHPNIGGFIIITAKNFIKKYQATATKKQILVDNFENFQEGRLSYEENFEKIFEKEIDVDVLKIEFINLLSQDDFNLYCLFYEKKQSVSQISSILSISENAVKVRLYRLREKVRVLVFKKLRANDK